MDFITFRCPSCNHGMKVGPDKAGRKAKCPKCQTELTIPKSEIVTAPAAAPPPDPAPEVEDEFQIGGSYNVVFDKELEERQKRLAAEEAAKKKNKPKAPRIEFKKKELKDKKKWLEARRCLAIFMFAAGTWGVAILLPVLMVVLGLFSGSNFAEVAEKFLLEKAPDAPPPNFVREVDPMGFAFGLIAGVDLAGLAQGMYILAEVLHLAAGGLFLTGYFLAKPVPDRFGLRGQINLLIILGITNMVLRFTLKLLPMIGLFGGWIPYITPEVAMGEGNIERALPLHIFWSFSGFWVEFLTQIVLFIQYLEPIMVGVMIWSMGQSMKESDLEEAGLGLSKIGFGVFFLLLSYHIVSCCGTSDVLLGVLRVLYVLWVGFSLGWVYRFFTVLFLARDTFDRRIFGVAYADELDKDNEDDEDEDDKD